FSTTTGCPSRAFRCSANSRAEKSAPPPAGKGTTMAIVLVGQVLDKGPAQLGTAATLAAPAHAKIRRRRVTDIICFPKAWRAAALWRWSDTSWKSTAVASRPRGRPTVRLIEWLRRWGTGADSNSV